MNPDGAAPDDVRGPSEGAVAGSADAVAGLALVEERLSARSPAEQQAFWEAVRRCFAGGTPPPGPDA